MSEETEVPLPTPMEDTTGGTGLKPGDMIKETYEILRLLGQGGMGAVFEAKHRFTGDTVALKVLRAELAHEPSIAARFLQEARSATEVKHRNIVKIQDFGVADGRYFMVMEFLRGESLSALMEREGTMAPGRIIRLVEPILRALQAAHDKGIVHRDIKPENIYLQADEDGGDPIPKLLDFGIAKRTAGDNVRLTATQMALGTPAYMAPEQVMGAKDATPAADQYAMGVLLYEALTGTIPHNAETYNAMIIAKVTSTPTHLDLVRADLDRGLTGAIMKALARDPTERFANMLALRDALLPFKDVLTVSGERSGTAGVLPHERTAVSGSPQGAQATMAAGSPATPAAVAPAEKGELWTTDADRAVLKAKAPNKAEIAETLAGQTVVPPIPKVTAPEEARQPERKAPPWAAISVAAVLLLGVGAFALRGRGGNAAPVPPVRVASAPPPPAAPAQVVFRVRAEPSSAEILLDGTVVGRGLAELIRPRDGSRHELQIRAAGYTTVSEVLTADSDTRIDHVLVAAGGAAAPPPAAPAAPPPPAEVHGGHGGRHPPAVAAPVGAPPPPAPAAPPPEVQRPHPPPRSGHGSRIDDNNPFN